MFNKTEVFCNNCNYNHNIILSDEYYICYMDDAQFELLVERAIETIPDEFKEKLENVSIVTADWPSHYQMKYARGGMLLGL